MSPWHGNAHLHVEPEASHPVNPTPSSVMDSSTFTFPVDVITIAGGGPPKMLDHCLTRPLNVAMPSFGSLAVLDQVIHGMGVKAAAP